MRSLRSAMRNRRAALTATEIAEHSRRIAHHLWRMPELARSRRIACYAAVAGEVDCGPFIDQALARGRCIYLPVVHGDALVFAPWRPGQRLVRNRFRISEPAGHGGASLRGGELDVVLAPLVAFDDAGHRLGMGGGFYDRTLRFVAGRGAWRHPRFIGLAHEFQRVTALPPRRWDLALHAIVTELGPQNF